MGTRIPARGNRAGAQLAQERVPGESWVAEEESTPLSPPRGPGPLLLGATWMGGVARAGVWLWCLCWGWQPALAPLLPVGWVRTRSPRARRPLRCPVLSAWPRCSRGCRLGQQRSRWPPARASAGGRRLYPSSGASERSPVVPGSWANLGRLLPWSSGLVGASGVRVANARRGQGFGWEGGHSELVPPPGRAHPAERQGQLLSAGARREGQRLGSTRALGLPLARVSRLLQCFSLFLPPYSSSSLGKGEASCARRARSTLPSPAARLPRGASDGAVPRDQAEN